jgi:diguanylate cyclase (GGDEF)-like protein
VSTTLSIPTVFICTSITTVIVALALSYLWATDGREKAIGWWCASMWAATIGTAMLATRTALPPWFSIGLGNPITVLAFGFSWAGFVAFSGERPSRFLAFAAAAAWLLLYFGVDAFRGEVNSRIIFISVVFATYGLLVVRCAWRGWCSERLPSYVATMIFFGLHSLVYLVRIPVTLVSPATEVRGMISAPWLASFVLEGFTLTIFSTFVFMALVKERAERRYRLAAEIDSLTGASSRRHFVSATRTALARRPKSAFLAVLDLDFFKKINDTYGHMAGDRVLQSFARHVSMQLQPGMVFGRLGGEEFGLFLPDCAESEAFDFLERLRGSVEDLDIGFNGNVLKITSSIGVAGTEEAGLDFDHLMAGADNALYIAKARGRNGVCMFSLAMRLEKIVENGGESRVSLAKKRVSRISVRSRLGRG